MENKSKSENRHISSEEMQKQSDFIAKIRALNSQKETAPRAFVETYGCQQNESDSEKIKGMLADMGYELCNETDSADLVLYNTCAVRENAELRVFGNLGALKHKKRRKPDMLIGVCGCMMQQEHIANTIKSKYRHVDMVFGTHALYRFPQILSEAMEKQRVFDIENETGSIFENISVKRDKPPLAKVPIMYGCNNFCTYCIVPYVRGRERSRSAEDILSECREVAEQGYKEIMLLGQNVNSYGNDLSEGLKFHELLREVCKIDGIERVRFMTSHPKDISDELIQAMAEEKKICKQLHLPVQSGSDKVLKDMNRKYTRAQYLEKLAKVRRAMPDIVLTTDIIVGFPTETQEDFDDTLSVLKEAEYDMIFSFIYSKRKGTPAAEMPDSLTDEQKHRNFDEMLRVQNEISKRKNDAYVGRTEEVLVEGVSKTNSDTLTGRTEGGKVVNFSFSGSGLKADELIGTMQKVKITQAQTWSLFGEL
ncbi:MAG: tRNA (N6-isopentenyl adenosine(37)-C2)-methylthiotransferase MiaB [Clostridiales bacterium]|nr:tRNA (N6-isopentenyl adenosine(37)-C2)-methylthiotransferase MiaB [Clostridiales bacterium]